jgi:glycosyltransferase involved in cell wall biosynthesis
MSETAESEMLTGHNLVYFGPEPWAGLWRNRHQLMTVFAQHNRVLYVEPRACLRPTLRRWREGKIRWTELRKPRLTKVQENLYVYHPPAFIPMSGRSPLREILEFTDRWMLRRAMKRLELQSPLIWLSRPSMLGRVGQFNEKMVIYHVVDEYAAYGDKSGASRDAIRQRDQQLLQLADLVIVVSQPLLEARKPYNPNTHLVPNAVNYEGFAETLNNQQAQPDDIAAIPRPVIGCSGLISRRLDLALLIELAEAHPEWSLVFVGAVATTRDDSLLKRLRTLSNVYFLGLKPVTSVPRYVSAFDVALIPYRLTEDTRRASPLKLYDYLACGKPVVTVDIPAVRHYAHLIQIVSEPSQFAAAIERSLTEPQDDCVVQRQAVAAENAWTQRVIQISHLIRSTLEAREGCQASEPRPN